jgi:hypothetical protein
MASLVVCRVLMVELDRCEVSATRNCLMGKARKPYLPSIAVGNVTIFPSWEPYHSVTNRHPQQHRTTASWRIRRKMT